MDPEPPILSRSGFSENSGSCSVYPYQFLFVLDNFEFKYLNKISLKQTSVKLPVLINLRLFLDLMFSWHLKEKNCSSDLDPDPEL